MWTAASGSRLQMEAVSPNAESFINRTASSSVSTGMIPMIHHGFRMFFVPEASAAIEWEENGDDNATHEATTRIISQWIAEILRFDDFMKIRLSDE